MSSLSHWSPTPQSNAASLGPLVAFSLGGRGRASRDPWQKNWVAAFPSSAGGEGPPAPAAWTGAGSDRRRCKKRPLTKPPVNQDLLLLLRLVSLRSVALDCWRPAGCPQARLEPGSRQDSHDLPLDGAGKPVPVCAGPAWPPEATRKQPLWLA